MSDSFLTGTRACVAGMRVRRICGVALACLMLCGPAAFAQEYRALWADAFSVGYKSSSQIDDLVARAVAGRYNVIVPEVLAYMDQSATLGGHGAYWNSNPAILPKALDISGGIDPLAELCTKAHAAGLEVDAWLVTYRVSTSWPPAGNTTLSSHPEWIMVPQANQGGGPAPIGGKYTLDPGSPEVQNYLLSIVRDLVANYPIDGINWDYIRYTQADAGYPASNSYAYSTLARYNRIKLAEPSLTWDDFRRRTIDELVRRCRAEIPLITSNPRQPVRLSADLFATGGAPGSFSSSQAYNYFQNWRYWMEQGYLDVGMPMNYKREHCTDEAAWYRSWVNAANGWRYQRHMICGQGNYLNSFANSVTQMQYCRTAGANGMNNYVYSSTRSTETVCDDGNDVSVADWTWYSYVANNLYTTTASIPDMPWRDPATATEGTIWGRVVDWDTGNPVDHGSVQVDSMTAVKTDANGYYTATLVPATAAGTPHTLKATANGITITHSAAYALAADVTRYDFSLGAARPRMSVAPTSLNRIVGFGSNLADDTFTITALLPSSRGPVNYFITDNAAWLAVTPIQGSSSGEADTLTIEYSTAALAKGSYVGTITIADAWADNSPQTVTINLQVVGAIIPGDFDHDEDVDQEDFAHLQACLTDVAVPPATPTCEDADLDKDNDIDFQDVAAFTSCFTGPGITGDPNCMDN